MLKNIDLIPEEERQEQVRKSAVKVGTILAVFILLIVLGFAAYLVYSSTQVKSEIASLETDIGKNRTAIKELSTIEISARSLDARYRALKLLFENRRYYSILLTELEKRLPASSIVIESLTLNADNTANVSGAGADYLSIARLAKNLADSNFSGAQAKLGALFTNVSLNSVNLDQQTSKAKFFIIVEFDPKLLRLL